MKYAFFLILLLPVVAQAYVSWRMWQLVPFALWGKVVMTVVLTLAFAAFFVAMMPQLDRLSLPVASACYEVGTSWVIVLLYMTMLFVVLDVLRWCHVVPTGALRGSWVATCVVVGLLVAVFAYGYAHYINKVRVSLALETPKPLSRPLRIVMTSDWHLGYHNRRAELARWIDMINAEAPDLVLVAGDIIDRSIRPLDDEDMAQEFHRLTAPVYACMGNHEYYCGEEHALRFYREAGIHLLRDSVAEVEDVVIVGRNDRSHGFNRPTIAELLQGVDVEKKYVVVLDHQPYALWQAEDAGVDIEFAGHTHHGQVWPATWITERLYECAYGEHRRGATRYYVSSGLGIWGGKFRIGSQSEYVVAELTTSFSSCPDQTRDGQPR